MFKGGQVNPYDEIVAKTTDENMTNENWELIMNICDKVQEEGEAGARNVVAAILKRLTHRTSNVQLYTLTLAESLTKNCGIEVHREIASRAFTQGLDRLITDRNTHDRVRKRALGLVAEWTEDFEKDPTLGVMEECYESLKSRGYKFEGNNEPPPPDVDDEVRRREEEELQRVLEMSIHDKGGRAAWSEYSLASSSGAGASGSSSSGAAAATSRSAQAQQQPVYGGYVPSASPAVSPTSNPTSQTPAPTVSTYNPVSSPAPSVKSRDSTSPVVTRVKALHTFEPTEPGELAFEKGDIIKVVDRNYKDWWRGQLKGRTGIFPVNYVEPLPEPTAAELAKEAEQEAAVFSQAANVDRLLTMLRQMDPAKDNLADNEEIQELYRSCMSLRPKIVKLIDKYSQKRADLVSMNETFVKARTIFDRMMEDSLARHSGVGYEQRPSFGSPYPRPDSRAPSEYPPQPYGWNAPGYEQPVYPAYPPAPVGYAAEPYPPGPQPQPYVDSGAYAQQAPYPPQPYGAPAPYGPPPNQVQPYPPVTPGQQAPQHAPQSQPTIQTQVPPEIAHPAQPQVPVQPPVQQQQPPPQPQQIAPAPAQSQPQAPALAPTQTSPEPQQQQQQPPSQPPPEAQAQPQAPQSGPPYVFDPKATYPDQNAQLWANYYAQGGTDPTGAVYFISVPGVTEAAPSPVTPSTGDGTPVGGTAPLNISHGGQLRAQPQASAMPSSPTQAPAPAQGFYQAAPPAGAPNMSNSSLSSAHSGAQPQGQGQPWQAQYAGLPNQLANMDVNRDVQGVGAPA